MKKILAIAPYSYLPYYSGGQKFIAQFFEWLGKETELTVVSVAENDAELVKNYKLIPLLRKGFSRYRDKSLISKLTALIIEEKFDMVVWEHPYFYWLAKKIKKKTGIHTLLHTHNIEYQRFRSTGRWWWPFLRTYEKRFFRMADHIFFISPEDKSFAINKWKIPPGKCIDLPFGVETASPPSDRKESREKISSRHGIKPDEKILFFNGLLKYKPNLDALRIILEIVNPMLLEKPVFPYKIIICGKDLPEDMNGLKAYVGKNIIYGGFTSEIELYYKASELLLNPVQSGGGVKTKIVEAIAYGTSVVSTETGAEGMEKSVCGNKLVIVGDDDWNSFSNAIVENIQQKSETGNPYYEYYYWGKIIPKVLYHLKETSE